VHRVTWNEWNVARCQGIPAEPILEASHPIPVDVLPHLNSSPSPNGGRAPVPETELIARVLADDGRAARELYDAHAPRVYRLVFRLCGDDELAQDFTQDVFIRAFGSLDRFRGDSTLSTWLHRIAITVTSNGLRKVRQLRDRESELDPDLSEGSAADESPPSEPHLRARLKAAVDALPEIYRTVLIMHDIEGYTHTQIANILHVPEGTCRRRLFAARGQLRDALAAFSTEQS
jgi:RNA polymerase sigma-70 factor, ECF subfamily